MKQDVSAGSELEELRAINVIYDLISDPEAFNDFATKIVGISENDNNLNGVKTALENSALIATRMSNAPDVDISRDIGIIVLGVNRQNKVTHAPPNLSTWLGAKYIGDDKGIGWIENSDQSLNIAHVLKTKSHDYIPVHSTLQRAFSAGQLSKLVIVHDFLLSQTALKAFKQLYSLTNAELRLCQKLAQGLTLAQAAVLAQTKKSTARHHLKGIFSKVGVHSQSGLIRILTQISAASAIQEFSKKNKVLLEPDWKNGLVSKQTEICTTRYGTQLTYSVYGDPSGRPVLFYHCGFGARHHSKRMAEAAKAQGILIYKPDRPGFGHSELLPNMSIKSIGAVTEDFLNHINVKKIDAIGFGVGGRTLLDVIPFVKGRICSATLYSFRGVLGVREGTIMKRLSHLIWDKPGIMMNFIRIARYHSTKGIAGTHLKKYFQDSISDTEYLNDPITLKQMLTEMHLSTRQDFKGSYFEHQNLRLAVPDLSDPSYNIPIKFIFGKNDPFNSYKDSRDYIDRFSNAKVYVAEGHGQLYITHNFQSFLRLAFDRSVSC